MSSITSDNCKCAPYRSMSQGGVQLVGREHLEGRVPQIIGKTVDDGLRTFRAAPRPAFSWLCGMFKSKQDNV